MIISLKDAIAFSIAHSYRNKHKKQYWDPRHRETMDAIIKRWDLQDYSYDAIARAIQSMETKITYEILFLFWIAFNLATVSILLVCWVKL